MAPRCAVLARLFFALATLTCVRPALAADGPWSRLSPPALQEQGLVVDAARARLLSVCGYDGVRPVNEVWELLLAGDVPWQRVHPTGTPPTGRRGAAVVLDSKRDRILVICGNDGTNDLAEVWELSTLSGALGWSQLSPSGGTPSGRSGACAVIDTLRDRVVVYGGMSGGGQLSDAWELSLAATPTWAPITPAGTPPSARRGPAAVYDAAADRMLVFGGYDGAVLNDLWELSFAGSPQWTLLTSSGGPPPERYHHSMVCDPSGTRAFVFGGIHTAVPYLNDAWQLDLSGTPTWSPITPAGKLPPGRFAQAAVYDTAGRRLIVYGGYDGFMAMGDLWSLPVEGTPAWTLWNPPGELPPGRSQHVAIWDDIGKRMVIYGGYRGLSLGDVWAYSPATTTWGEITPQGTPPLQRLNHSAIYDPVRRRMIIFGGVLETGAYLNDTWALTLDANPTWSRIDAPVLPDFREGHGAIYDPVGDRMIIFGGFGGPFAQLLDDAWALSLSGPPVWTKLTPDGVPPFGRLWFASAYDSYRQAMLISGGDFGFGAYDDAWALSLTGTPAWSQIFPPVPAPGRRRHAGIYDAPRDRLIVTAGLTSQVSNDTWALSFQASPIWNAINPLGDQPPVRDRFTAVYDPTSDRMLIFGGLGDAFPLTPYLNDLWSLALDATTPVLVSLVSARVEAGVVRVEWALSGYSGEPVRIERRLSAGEWTQVTTIVPDGTGRVVYEDHDVKPGARYTYRLGVRDQGRDVTAGETWVDVPATLALALRGAVPNPAAGTLWIGFTLTDASAARLEVTDVAGRRVAAREVGGLGAGVHRVQVGATLPAGIYIVRLAQGGRVLTSKVAVMR